GRVWSIHAADLDGDGDLDVLSALLNDNTIAWFENQGGGDFSDRREIWTDAVGPWSALVADLDNDGDLDVVSASSGDHTVAWYENLATPTTTPTLAPANVSVRGGGNYIAVNWDAVPEWANGGSVVLRYVATATPDDDGASATCVTVPPSTSCAIDDLRPGVTYAVVVLAENALGAGPASVSVDAKPDDELLFKPEVITTDADGPTSVRAADLDGDGEPDILSASRIDDTIAWHENLGDGAFSGRTVFATGADAVEVHAADLDGDGDLDVLAALDNDNTIAWYENLGSGAFSARRDIATDARGAKSVYAADLDGDGDADVLSAVSGDDTVAWHENLGNGEFSARRVIGSRADASVVAADFDGDGDPDVLSGSGDWDRIVWQENLGGGEFSVQRDITTSVEGVESVHAADLDGDGDPDVLSASWNDDTITWYENLGDGAFSGQHVITTAADYAQSVHAADLDGDGDLDVLSASYEDDKIAWYENLGGSFSQQRTIATDADGAGSVHVADLDGDGDPDVVSASYLDDKIAWYENHFDRGDDHGDEPAAATLAPALPAFLHGVVKSGGDRDVFRVATGSGTLRAYSNGPMDTRGSLMSTSGTVLATDDDDGTDRNFRIEHDVAAGVHYIEVRGFNASATGRYTLSIEFVADTSQNSEDES
ncbi:MAG: hypothetical protein F4053_12415, partial [Proteobacteria bacterium]|nr:hypothetical protein [Pseudomonadota bacterium]